MSVLVKLIVGVILMNNKTKTQYETQNTAIAYLIIIVERL